MNNSKIKMFVECYLPMTKCNMHCEYCYIHGHNNSEESFCDFSEIKEKAAKAFSYERFGGTCLFNICAAGETMLHPDLAEVAHRVLKCGHYLMIVTNGTLTNRIKEYCGFEKELKEKLFFKVSLHYLELKRLKLVERFCENIELIKSSGISYTIEITPDDSYIPYIDEIKEFCLKRFGALCHVTVPRDERKIGYPLMTGLPREKFIKTWESFNSPLFDFKESIFEVPRKEFCYAGKWSIVLNISSGDYYQCYKGLKLGNVFECVDKPLNLFPIGNNCPEGHCFNGHAFLGFGLIPEINGPTFADMRNRTLKDGTMWLSEPMKGIMQSHLYDSNSEYSCLKKTCISEINRLMIVINKCKKASRRLISGN